MSSLYDLCQTEKKSVWHRSYSEDINLGSLKVSFLVLQKIVHRMNFYVILG